MSDRLLVGTRKGLFTITRAAKQWSIERVNFLGDPVSMVLADRRDGTLYAALGHGHFGVHVHRSRDGGSSWQECAAPVYPPKPDGLDDNNPVSGQTINWTTELIWSLAAGHSSQPGTLWCGTLPGGLFRSDNGADSWKLNESLWFHPRRKEWFGGGAEHPGIHSVCVDPADGQHVYIGVSCGGVWETLDGGGSWDCRADGMHALYMPPELATAGWVQDVHQVALCPAEPRVMWAQHHNGVFMSTDGAASWQEVSSAGPSTFGFAVAMHPHRPDTVWLVPSSSDQIRVPVEGKVVVTRTRDGGKTFETLRTGLPQNHAYDLTLRHALDVDGSGQQLAFGTTTGGLWASDDEGDSWQTVSEHLPPVYVVRFA